jgi:hypothetical protein
MRPGPAHISDGILPVTEDRGITTPALGMSAHSAGVRACCRCTVPMMSTRSHSSVISSHLAVGVRRGGVVLAAVLALAILPFGSPVARAADPTSDIPGVPLPGTVTSGLLGGPIYDVVYRLDVAPGSVILARVTGSSGTDFDLYLFEGSATTVVTNQGVIARSTGPTSTESILYATPIGGRFYVDLNSATAAVGTYTLVVRAIPDRPAIRGHARPVLQ